MVGNATAQPQMNATLCSEGAGLNYKYYGIPETCFWSLAGIMTIPLNSYYLYMHIKNSQRRTKYIAYLSFLLGSNVFIGATVYPFMVIWGHRNTECNFGLFVVLLGMFCLTMPMLLTSMITIDRQRTILRMAKHPVQNMQGAQISNLEFLLKCAGVTLTCVTVALLRMFVPKFGTALAPILGISFVIVNVSSLSVIIRKIKQISTQSERQALSSSLARFKRTVLMMKALIATIIIAWLPISITLAYGKLSKFSDVSDVVPIAMKVLFLRPVFLLPSRP